MNNLALDLDEFPRLNHFTDDIDSFAEDTGYEGAFSNREFVFAEFKNVASEHYDYFDPYDEEEWIVAGSVRPKNVYGVDYDSNKSEPFEVNHSTFEQSENTMQAY